MLVRDKHYKAPPIFVLDPLEITALGIKVRKGVNGETRWERMKAAKWAHPDPLKTYCFAHGALIYVHIYPERTAPGMRPPEAWKREAGITEESLWEARQLLELQDPGYGERRDFRQQLNEELDE